ncbi:MAG: TonB-like protein [Acidobacteriales bacterium]|nr:TonB-like protein [Terriglobales bacterium]
MASLAAHVILLALLLWQPSSVIKPRIVMKGDRGSSMVLVYVPSHTLPRQPESQAHSAVDPPRQKSRKLAAVNKAPVAQQESEGSTAKTTLAGTPYGSQSQGLTYGPEVRPALPVSGDRPSVASSELPQGVHGDVIVEITIDIRGNVVESKLLKSIGYGIDQKVLATLQNWRFTPATKDGVPIPSQQDVYFHFPS